MTLNLANTSSQSFNATLPRGSVVALVTPMFPDGQLDLDTFRRLIDWHISEGSDAIVVVGTTGESPTVTVDEHIELIRVAVDHAQKRIPIIAGTGANSTQEAIELTGFARDLGAVASLSVVPYYNRPTQEGLYQHFRKIAESVELPLILYNVPGRTVVDMNQDTVVRLAQIPNILGIKDATGDIGRGAELMHALPPGFGIYTGDDLSSAAFLLLGGHGTISVTANIAPKAVRQLCQAAAAQDVELTLKINRTLLGLHRYLFVEPNPIPVKWALAEVGLIKQGIRLPLTPLSSQYHLLLRAAMLQAGIDL